MMNKSEERLRTTTPTSPLKAFSVRKRVRRRARGLERN